MEELLFRLTSSDSASSAQSCNISQLTQPVLNSTRGTGHKLKARAIAPDCSASFCLGKHFSGFRERGGGEKEKVTEK